MHRALLAVTDHAGRVHHRQRRWAAWQRLLWWLVLLPLALACWASLQTSAPKQWLGWGLTALVLGLGVSAAAGDAQGPAPLGDAPFDAAMPVVTPSATSAPDLSPAAATVAPSSTATPSSSAMDVTPTAVAVSPQTSIQGLAALPKPEVRSATPAPVVITQMAPPAPAKPAATQPAPSVTTRPAAPPVTTRPAAPPVTTPPPVAAGTSYQNCTELRKDYPHGVGRPGAVDKTSGSAPVTNYEASTALYEANTKSDRDKDGIACEQH